jgi:hypothetical protein
VFYTTMLVSANSFIFLSVSPLLSRVKGVRTIVSNTNTSMSTEEGEAQGAATVYFMETLADRPTVPLVLSLSLGSLSFGACDQICAEIARTTTHTYAECHDYIQKQRQVRKQKKTEKFASNFVENFESFCTHHVDCISLNTLHSFVICDFFENCDLF